MSPLLRNSLIGLLAFGLSAAVAGYVWTTFEFPFVIVVPAALGWYAVVFTEYGRRKAMLAALVGGATFTIAFLVAMFFALTDGSPIALTAWMSATLAAALAGAVTGLLVDGWRGVITIAAFSALGMLVATIVSGALRTLAPSAVDVVGPAQSAYFAMQIGLVGGIVGAAVGAGTSWLAAHRGSGTEETPNTNGTRAV